MRMRLTAWVLLAGCSGGKGTGDTGGNDTDTEVGTGSGSGTTPVTCGAPSLEVGTGDFHYEPFPATDPSAEVIHGTQGAWHVWVGGAMVGLGPRIVNVPTLVLVDTDTAIAGDPRVPEIADLSAPPVTVGLVSSPQGVATDCGWEFGGGHAFLLDHLFGGGLTNWEAIQQLDGLTARLDVTVYDLDSCAETTVTQDEEDQTAWLETCPVSVSGTSPEFTLRITQNSSP